MSEDESPKKKLKVSHEKDKTEEEEEWREVFNIFDLNGDNCVSASELGTILRGLGFNPTQKDLHDMIHKIDANNTGKVEWEEFADLMQNLKMTKNQEKQMDEMIRAFKFFDYNNDDHIDAAELTKVMTTLGDTLTLDEVNQMISVADMDKDGRINYVEFVKFIFSSR